MNLPWLLSSAAIIVNKCMAYPGPKCLRKEKLEWIGGQNWEKSIFLQWLMDDVCTRSLAVNPLNASKDCTIRQVNDSVYMNIVAQCTHSLVLTLFSLQRRYQATCFTTTWSKQSICSRCSYIQFIIHLVYINGTKQKCKWVIVYCGCTPEYFHHISINDVIEISLFSLFSLFAEVFFTWTTFQFFCFCFIASEIELCCLFIYMIDDYYLTHNVHTAHMYL